MKRICLFICLLTMAIPAIHAQETELGVWGGSATYLGDLNPNFNLKGSQYGTGIYLRNVLNSRFAFKHGLNYARVGFSDAQSGNTFATQRNLSFESRIFELHTQLEINFFEFIHNHKKKYYTPYIGIGVSGFYFNPQAQNDDGEWVDLQPLGTEGQLETNYTGREPYSLVNFAVSLSVGWKYSFGRFFVLGVELSNRRTFTDYLDDVSTTYVSHLSLPGGDDGQSAQMAYRTIDNSAVEGNQRGTSSKNDQFMYFGLSLSYTFLDIRCPSPSGRYR